MTSRSVPRGVAFGLFVGVIIPVMHTAIAAVLAIPVRANVAVAAAVHPGRQSADHPAALLCRLSYRRPGSLHHDATLVNPAAAERFSSELSRLLFWIHQASGPIAVGVLTIAVGRGRDRLCGSALAWRVWLGKPMAPAPASRGRAAERTCVRSRRATMVDCGHGVAGDVRII